MKKLLNKKNFVILGDILLIPFLFFCQRLSAFMLSNHSECKWALLGGKCVTCGGTHFVNALLSGRLSEAFFSNPFLFLLTVFLLFSLLLLNLDQLLGVKFAKKILSKLYTIPMLILWLSAMLIFLLARNAPVFIRIFEDLTNA